MDAVSKKTFATLNPCTAEKIVDVAAADKVKEMHDMHNQTSYFLNLVSYKS